MTTRWDGCETDGVSVCVCVCVLCAATAVMAVANIVKTSLGPVGLDKVR